MTNLPSGVSASEQRSSRASPKLGEENVEEQSNERAHRLASYAWEISRCVHSVANATSIESKHRCLGSTSDTESVKVRATLQAAQSHCMRLSTSWILHCSAWRVTWSSTLAALRLPQLLAVLPINAPVSRLYRKVLMDWLTDMLGGFSYGFINSAVTIFGSLATIAPRLPPVTRLVRNTRRAPARDTFASPTRAPNTCLRGEHSPLNSPRPVRPFEFLAPSSFPSTVSSLR
jgi:hypothetical protein